MVATLAIMKTYLAPFLSLALWSGVAGATVPDDHREFEATLSAPYRGQGGRQLPDARTFTLSFDYPGLQRPQAAAWRLELLAPSGRRLVRWQGRATLSGNALRKCCSS